MSDYNWQFLKSLGDTLHVPTLMRSGPKVTVCGGGCCTVRKYMITHITTSRACYETGSLAVYRCVLERKHTPFSILICISTVPVYGPQLYRLSLMNPHTVCWQAEEEEGLLRTFKQKDIFRKVLLSRETKKGSDMTLHRRESEGHRWRDGHAYGTVSVSHV